MSMIDPSIIAAIVGGAASIASAAITAIPHFMGKKSETSPVPPTVSQTSDSGNQTQKSSQPSNISGRSVAAGVLSLILPGIGQAVNSNNGNKVVTHFILGLVLLMLLQHPTLFHFWSAYDALVDRKGGYWRGRI